MDKNFKIKHSFNSGDLILLLPGVKDLYNKTGKKTIIYQRLNLKAFYYDGAKSPTKDYDGEMVCMNESIFNMLKPLIESEDYIESLNIWKGEQVDMDIDLTRDSKWCPMPAGLIHYYAWALYPQLSCDLSERWINTNRNNINDTIIVNRTSRYQNPYISYYFLKQYQNRIMFAGTKEEHSEFDNEWGLKTAYLKVGNFLELSNAMDNCKLFLGNQSFCWHLADSKKIPRILELNTHFPNTFPTGANGHGFYRQQSFEYLVNKMLND